MVGENFLWSPRLECQPVSSNREQTGISGLASCKPIAAGSITYSETPIDMMKLTTIIRKSGYRGNVRIETLAMKRRAYNPFVEAPMSLKRERETMRANADINPNDRK